MTDEERLRNAGWSPNSLRLAMGDFDTSDCINVDEEAFVDVFSTGSRQDLKRTTNANVSTPTTSLRGFKLVDYKATPNFPSRNISTIDLSLSTVKKPICSLQCTRYDDGGNDDDNIMVLTQRFRRQSIDPDTIKSDKIKVDHTTARDENSIPFDQNCIQNLDQNTPNRVRKQFNFGVVSPTSSSEQNLHRKFRGGIDSSNHIGVEDATPITAVLEVNRDVDQSTQMSKLIAAADLDSVLPNGWKLFKHQKDAVLECLKLGRTIMAFDMGLGKTIISLIWAKAVCTLCPDCIAIIIVPCTLTEIWKREAEMIGFTTVDIHAKNVKLKHHKNGTDEKVRGPRISIHSWSKIPSAAEINQRFVLIADEAHAMQSITSIRTKNTLNICLHGNCLGLVLSTGTPMKNGRPSNILPLLIGIRHPVAQNKIEFEKKYCNAKKTKFCAWDVSGASNLEDLRTSIGPYLMRKTKEECLDLPALTRSTIKVEIHEETLTEYNTIITNMKQKMKSSYSRQNNNTNGGNSACLEMMSQLRIFSSKSKVPGTADFIRRKLMDCLDPIVVFVWFKDTSSLLQQNLLGHQEVQDGVKLKGKSSRSRVQSIRCECLTGDIIKHQSRQEMVDRFQNGETDVLICTFGVGSTGLTLTRSHTVILLDRPWTPGDAAQAEDRVRRIGQLSTKVESIWIEAFELDKKLDSMLENKSKNTAKVLSSNSEQNKTKGSKSGTTCPKGKSGNSAPIKTLDDFFNPLSNRVSHGVSQAGEISNSEGSGSNNLSFGGDGGRWEGGDDNEGTQSSIMTSVFRHIMR